MKTKIPHLILAGLFGTTMAAHATLVVFETDFTGTNFADEGLTNEGIAGSGNWVHNSTDDRADFDWLARNARAALYTTDTFQSPLITIDVSFQQDGLNVSRFSIGLVDSGFSGSSDGDWLNQGMPGAYGIGLSTDGTVEDSNANKDALAFNAGGTPKNDFTDVTTLSTAQGNITKNTLQTFSMTVTADSWSYSLNGAEATTGTHTFDMSRSYRFITYQQATSSFTTTSGENSYFSSITISVPEPSSTALLGLGLSSLLLRRRRS